MTIDLSDLLQDGVYSARRIRRILKFCFRRFVGSAAFAAFIGLFASAALADSPATAGIAAGGIENLCARLSFEETSYIVCTVPRDLKAKEGNLRLFWKDRSGQPYRRFSALSDALAAKGETLAFAMNAGMYSDEFVPVGLYVENGHEACRSTRAAGRRARGRSRISIAPQTASSLPMERVPISSRPRPISSG